MNPFLTMMYYRISFNAWHNASRRNKEKLDYIADPENNAPPGAEIAALEKIVDIEVDEIVEFTSDEEDEREMYLRR